MKIPEHSIGSGCFWYPFRPSLRWPIRWFAIVAMLLVVTKLVVYRQWLDATGLIWTGWLLGVTLEAPQPKRKTPRYYAGAALSWLAVLATVVLLGLWVVGR